MRTARRRSPLTSLTASVVLAALLTASVPAVGTLAAPPPIRVQSEEVSTSVTHRRIVPLKLNASHVTIRWAHAHDAEITLAFAERPNEFGEEIPVGHSEESDHEGEDTYGSVLWTGGARFVRVTTDRPIGRLTVIGIDAKPDKGLSTQAGVASAATSQPNIVSRAEWGADESKRFDSGGNETWPPEFSPMQKAIVHHTAGRNNDPNPAATVRAIYHMYAITRDFGDMGYNFLIDESGRIYEGRYSRPYASGEEPTGEDLAGNVVRGVHASSHNYGTVGIVLLGTFTNRLPTAAARTSLERLLAWKFERHGLDPQGASVYVGLHGPTKSFPNIAGHRQVSSTACPGATFFPTFPTLRQNVANRIAATTGPDNDSTPPAVKSLKAMVPNPTGSKSIPFGLVFSEPVTDLDPSDFQVGGTSGGWSVASLTGAAATWTVTLTHDNPSPGTVSLTLPAGSVTDLAGLAGPGAAATGTGGYATDTIGPTVSLYHTPHKTYFRDPGLEYLNVTAVFSEPVKGFEPSDIEIGGTAHAAAPWSVPAIYGSGAAYGFSVYNDGWANGTLTLRVAPGSVTDLAGNPVLSSNTIAVALDRSGPTSTAPLASLRPGVVAPSTKTRLRLTWSATDVGPSGVATYDVRRSRNGGAFTTIATGLTSPALNVAPKVGHSYRYQVRARDKAGNVGAWKTGPTLKPKILQQTNTNINYGGGWKSVSSSAYLGGSARYATAAGARATFTTKARSLAFVTTRGPNRGAVRIYVDGSLAATVDLHASSTQTRYVAFSKSWSSTGTHTIRIEVVGTSGRPRVDLDAFVVVR